MNNVKWQKILRMILSAAIAAAWLGFLMGFQWARELWSPLLAGMLRWPAAGRYFALLLIFAVSAAIVLYPLKLFFLFVPGPLADRIYWIVYTKLGSNLIAKAEQACQRQDKAAPAWLMKLDEHGNQVLLRREACIDRRNANTGMREQKIVITLRLLLILAILLGITSILFSAGGDPSQSEGTLAGYRHMAYSHWRSLDMNLVEKAGLHPDQVASLSTVPAQAAAAEKLRCTPRLEMQAAEGCALYLIPDEGSLAATIEPGVPLSYHGGISDDGINKWIEVAIPFGGSGWVHPDALAPASTVSADTISPAEAAASSYLTDPTGAYPASNAIDANHETAWTADGTDPENKLDLKFSEEVAIGSILFVNGFAANPMLYQMNDRVRKLQITFSGDETVTCEVPDVYSPNGFELQLNRPVKASSLRFTVEEVYKGSTYQGVCISEIAVHPAD